MFSFQTEMTIAAAAERIWAVLTDARKLEKGFGIVRIEGDIAPGARIKLWSEVAPKRAFPLRVTEFDAPRRMVWTGGMPLGLFTGVRTFSLTPLPGGATRFDMREVYSGPMSGMIRKSMPDLTPSFQTFAKALKRETET